MKVVYHEDFTQVYASDPAAQEGRIESFYNGIKDSFEMVRCTPATDDDVLMVHGRGLLNDVKQDTRVYEMALLAAGGACVAARIGHGSEAAFGLIRPPGHHASRDSHWGFCYFNNMAVSIEKLKKENGVKKVLVLDFDLHFGDGNVDCLEGDPNVFIFNPGANGRQGYMEEVEDMLAGQIGGGYDIIAVSAGFDNYKRDWGGTLETQDYHELGDLVKGFAIKECQGRRYALLEGGYFIADLGKNLKAFLLGME